MSSLKQAINFSILTVLKILNSVNAGVDLGLATPLTTATTVSFFLTRIALIRSLYDHIRDVTITGLTINHQIPHG